MKWVLFMVGGAWIADRRGLRELSNPTPIIPQAYRRRQWLPRVCAAAVLRAPAVPAAQTVLRRPMAQPAAGAPVRSTAAVPVAQPVVYSKPLNRLVFPASPANKPHIFA